MSTSNDRGFESFKEPEEQGKIVKCPSCGGNMTFDPATQTLYCEYCGNRVDFEKDKEVKEIAIEKAFAAAEKWNDAVTVRCDNCGAKVVISANEVATRCPYCGTAQIKKTEEIAGIKPNAVYPFTVTEQGAEDCAKRWCKKRLFAPRKFKKQIAADNLKGVFQPCFTFDSDTFSTYDGRVGKRRTRTVGTGKNQRTETYIEWKIISGTFSRFFDDVTIAAAKEFDQKKLNKIMPFNINTIAVYEKKYLAGYVANHYDKDVKTAWIEAKSTMDSIIRKAIIAQYNCDVVDYLNVSTNHQNVTYKYVLLPIYFLSYKYRKKQYGLFINGNTGKVSGKTPISPLRVAIAVLLGLGALIGILYFIARNGAVDEIMSYCKELLPF